MSGRYRYVFALILFAAVAVVAVIRTGQERTPSVYEKLLKPEDVKISVGYDLDDMSYVPQMSFVRVRAFHDQNENGVNDDEPVFHLRIVEDRETREALQQVAESVSQALRETTSWIVVTKPKSRNNDSTPRTVDGEVCVAEDAVTIVKKESRE